MQSAVTRARKGEGPSLIEAVAYRMAGHFAADKATYRSSAEAEEWRIKDPVLTYERKLLDKKVLSQEEAEKIHQELAREVATAKKQALQDPEPDADDLGLDQVYAVSA